MLDAPYVDLRLHMEKDGSLNMGFITLFFSQLDCWFRLCFLALSSDPSFELEFHNARLHDMHGGGLALPLQVTTWILLPVWHFCRIVSSNVLWGVVCQARPEVADVRDMLQQRHCRSYFSKKKQPPKPAADAKAGADGKAAA